jgi:hypothetical protein
MARKVKDFFQEYDELLNQKRIRQQQECVGWNPEENVQTNETNENPTKKTFSRATTKKI